MDLDCALGLQKGARLKANMGWMESGRIKLTRGKEYELLMDVLCLVRDGEIVNVHLAIKDDYHEVRYPSYHYFEAD